MGTQIIVGNIGVVINIQDATVSGAHIRIVPPRFPTKMVDHKYRRHTARQFLRDGQRVLGLMKPKAKV